MCMKLSTERVAIIKGRQDESQAFYMATMAKVEKEEEIHPEVMEVIDKSKVLKTKPNKALEKFSLEDE